MGEQRWNEPTRTTTAKETRDPSTTQVRLNDAFRNLDDLEKQIAALTEQAEPACRPGPEVEGLGVRPSAAAQGIPPRPSQSALADAIEQIAQRMAIASIRIEQLRNRLEV